MKMTREEMLATLGKRDPTLNGKFIIGVLSTGIYCLPSCHARTPKAENVQFFANGADAETAGLRPCKKCRPDEFERGENPELDRLEHCVDHIRSSPSAYSNVESIANALDVGSTKLNALFRLHYQQTPADLLLTARLEFAKKALLGGSESIAEVAIDCGFESLSVFNQQFKRTTGLTPSGYRLLAGSRECHIELPEGYNLSAFLRTFGRDPLSPSERLSGSSGLMSTPSGDLIEIEFGPATRIRVVKGSLVGAYEVVARVMALNQDVKPFESQAVAMGFDALLTDRRGSRLPQTTSLLDGLIWAITGQQVNLPFAFALRRRLFERFGEPLGGGLFTLPTWERIADAEPAELLALQFSRQKAGYLIGIANLGSGWGNQIERTSYTRAKANLLATRGIGIWSSQYILMRSLGFLDCLPLGDTGLTAGVSRLFELESKPTIGEIERLMAPFAPYRSLMTYHLWQSLK